MKRWFVILILVLFNLSCYSQIGSLGIEINYNKFSLANFKSFRNELLNTLPIKAKITDNFPPNIGFKILYFNKYKNFKFSAFFGFNSTGGRISYGDYSGKFLIDQIIDIYSTGVQLYIPLTQWNNYSLFLTPKSSLAFTSIKFTERIEIYSDVQEETIKLRSTSVGFGLGLTLRKKIKFIELSAECGYDYLFPSGIHPSDDQDSYLVDSHSNKVNCELDGWRTGIGLFFDLDYLLKRSKGTIL